MFTNYDEPGWKKVERVSALLEKTLTPDAKVEHDVRLPVIGSNRKRQCDVVITYGEEPRKTITIVEVQKRNKKPDINTFHGWCRKMQEVGAQQLICVSALGYPPSIKEDVATRIGPTVKLMTLKELEGTEPGGNIIMLPYFIQRRPHYKIIDTGVMELGIQSKESENGVTHLKTEELRTGTFGPEEKIFLVGENPERVNLNFLITKTLENFRDEQLRKKGVEEPNEYVVEIVVSNKDENIYFVLNEIPYLIKNWHVKVNVTNNYIKIDTNVTQYAYKQEYMDGALAWVSSTKVMNYDKWYEVQIVFKPNKDGFLELSYFRAIEL